MIGEASTTNCRFWISDCRLNLVSFCRETRETMPGLILASSHHIGSPRPSGESGWGGLGVGLGVRGGALGQFSAWVEAEQARQERKNSDARLDASGATHPPPPRRALA